ncbi:hypothetical protein U9M48_001767 [Paspalum notatum var. saurae]|uniref:Glucan endo-1,3-beta-D-glucosidase n=1 Tax=Paspalum notatum var. saurae TaxID=547442 RepID=A0AAQ3SFG0_PASNO
MAPPMNAVVMMVPLPAAPAELDRPAGSKPPTFPPYNWVMDGCASTQGRPTVHPQLSSSLGAFLAPRSRRLMATAASRVLLIITVRILVAACTVLSGSGDSSGSGEEPRHGGCFTRLFSFGDSITDNSNWMHYARWQGTVVRLPSFLDGGSTKNSNPNRTIEISDIHIGVSYGVIDSGLPSKSNVVQLYKSNGIGNMRFYFADQELLNALCGSGIGLTLDVGNDKVHRRPERGARVASVLQAMQNVHDAIASAGLAGGIKVSIAVKMDMIHNSSPPSNGVFKDPSVMSPIVQFLAANGAPLLVNVYPYFPYEYNQDMDLSYALFQPSSTMVADPNGLA